MLIVHAVGPLALIQDEGRPGQAAIGVSPGGAADRASYALANRLVGNPSGAATIEVLMGGLTFESTEPVVIAATGAPGPLTVDGRGVSLCAPVRVGAGEQVSLGMPIAGLRSYVAVRGGLAVPAALGSRSSDPTSGLGLPPLRVGDVLPVGDASSVGPDDLAPVTGAPHSPPVGALELPAILGPRDDWLTPASTRALGAVEWTVGTDLDRVGVRLTGPTLERARSDELASEGLVRGAVQVPPSGQPVIFLADHPTTGGYPVVAVVDDAATDRLAQLRPGDRVRFTLRRARWT